MDAARDAMDAVRDVIPVAYSFGVVLHLLIPILFLFLIRLLEGWEEEEIIDKKDSAEGKTPNLPYRNSVSDVTNSVFVQLGKMMGVNVPMESRDKDRMDKIY
ncbi:hypothetical protein GQR58_027847 [Nymphon striatum]|nr:hypothetical protein GQR58_027847 [Nymphon striatum]